MIGTVCAQWNLHHRSARLPITPATGAYRKVTLVVGNQAPSVSIIRRSGSTSVLELLSFKPGSLPIAGARIAVAESPRALAGRCF